MALIQCKMCGGEVELPEGMSSGVCPYCGSLTTFPKSLNGHTEQLYSRAEHFRRNKDFDRAAAVYEQLIQLSPDDPETYWGLVISRFGIEYVEDPVSHERIPTCHRVQFDSILSDGDYLQVLELSSGYERDLYEKEAKQIADIQKNILAISAQEKPYDVFICYKDAADDGTRTKDSALAQDIYYRLIDLGYKVFFSRITLEDKLGQQYEPYIFAALNSARVMLVIGTKKEYFEAVWVRNEWSRFLALMKKDRFKLLIPCYSGIGPYDLPDELSMFQAQDMSKIGFLQDLEHGIKKVIEQKSQTQSNSGNNSFSKDPVSHKNNPLLRRAQLFIEHEDFESALEYCEKVLDEEPENGWAYFYRLLAECKIKNEKQLLLQVNSGDNKTFKLALRFADEELKKKIETLRQFALQELEYLKMQKEKERLAQLKDTPQRIDLLAQHLAVESELDEKPHYIKSLTEHLKKEQELLDDLRERDFPLNEDESDTPESEMDFEVQLEKYKQLDRELNVRSTMKRGYQLIGMYDSLEEKTARLKQKKKHRRKQIRFWSFLILILILFCNSVTIIRFGRNLIGDICILSDSDDQRSVCGVLDKTAFRCVIPSSVLHINNSVFQDCYRLSSVKFNENLETIATHAFKNCTGLKKITLPDSVIRIAPCAFEGCVNLKEAVIPNTCEYISSGKNASFPPGCKIILRKVK